MTMTLAHPAAEDLGRFVEGTLDERERNAIVAHIADCDECRLLIVDSAEFVEPVVVHSERRWWLAAAASVVLVVATTFLVWKVRRDPLGPLIEVSKQMKPRPVAGRLEGFSYQQWSPTRGSADATDLDTLRLQGISGQILESSGDDPATIHAHGVAHLVAGESASGLKDLLDAARHSPNQPHYWSDLAVAQIATGNSRAAIESADRVLKIDSHSVEALFNRAVALEVSGRSDEAIATCQRYLALDSTSQWADEVRRMLERMRQSKAQS